MTGSGGGRTICGVCATALDGNDPLARREVVVATQAVGRPEAHTTAGGTRPDSQRETPLPGRPGGPRHTSRKFYRRSASSPVEHARRQAWGQEWGQIVSRIAAQVRAGRQ